mmetsp:Transcript_73987/g.130940  ORF Transcript_73987/g.130940 Transcript_73987/m.130940 type:complete len:141 (-) Transcript_73987:20-442(-)
MLASVTDGNTVLGRLALQPINFQPEHSAVVVVVVVAKIFLSVANPSRSLASAAFRLNACTFSDFISCSAPDPREWRAIPRILDSNEFTGCANTSAIKHKVIELVCCMIFKNKVGIGKLQLSNLNGEEVQLGECSNQLLPV